MGKYHTYEVENRSIRYISYHHFRSNQSGKYGGFGEDLPGAGIIFPGAPGAEVPKKHPGCIGCPRSSAFGTSLVLKNIFFRKDPGAITLCGVTN